MNYDLSKIRIKCAELLGAKWSRLAENENDPKHWQLGFTHKDRQSGRNSFSAGTPWQVDFIVAEKPDDSLPHMVGEDVPKYHESADAALELAGWMAKPENGACLWSADNVTNRPKYTVYFFPRKGAVQATADTFQLALCLAFLKANGINTETL